MAENRSEMYILTNHLFCECNIREKQIIYSIFSNQIGNFLVILDKVKIVSHIV